MTEQYLQRNINEQGNNVLFTASIAVPDITLQPAVQMVTVDETLSGSTVLLPRAAAAGQNAQVTVVNLTGTNPVLIGITLGDALLAAPGVVNPITLAGGTLTLRADADNNRWVAVAGTV